MKVKLEVTKANKRLHQGIYEIDDSKPSAPHSATSGSRFAKIAWLRRVASAHSWIRCMKA